MYTEKKLSLLQLGDGAADDLSGTGLHGTSYLCGSQMQVTRVMAHVSTLMNGAATIECKKRPTQGSATGESVVATLIVPDASAVGTVVYKDFDPVVLEPGDELVYEVTSAATSGGAHYLQEIDDDPEQPSEQPDMVASA